MKTFFPQIEASLDALPLGHQIAFGAYSTEVWAPGFLNQVTGRPADVELFNLASSAVWRMVLDEDRSTARSLVERLEAFPEVLAEEEADDVRFYAEYAVVLLMNALRVAAGEPGAVQDVVGRATTVADAVDQDLETEPPSHLEREMDEELAVVALLLTHPSLTEEVLATLRQRAARSRALVAEAVHRVANA